MAGGGAPGVGEQPAQLPRHPPGNARGLGQHRVIWLVLYVILCKQGGRSGSFRVSHSEAAGQLSSVQQRNLAVFSWIPTCNIKRL